MNTPQTRFITLSAMKVTNTEHTALNGNQSKCRMTQSQFGWRIDEVRWDFGAHRSVIKARDCGFFDLSPFFLIQNKTNDFGASFLYLRRSALQERMQCTASSTLIHATFPASTCDRPCKYLREKTPLYRNLFPHVFLLTQYF